MADPWLVLAAAGVEGAVGYPERLHRRVPHPVSWAAALIGALERRLNVGGAVRRRAGGVLTLILAAGLAGGIGFALDRLTAGSAWGFALAAVLGAFGLAARSLYDHVAAVARPLAAGDLLTAREAVGRIVGRDVEALNAEGVAAAALESLAESFNDGVVAPLFWFLIGGLGGLFAYKAVNTADSLIGHREAPFTHFGWASARCDDLLNLVPARLTGGLVCIVGGRGWRTMARDARGHASPNSGWPEAAMAGALGVRLGGPAAYDGVITERPSFGDGSRPGVGELRRGLRLYLEACALIAFVLAVGGFAWPR